MGSEKPSCPPPFDPRSNINMCDRKLLPGEQISRDPSPREEDRRRGTDVDRGRYKDTDPREGERLPAPRERERRRQEDRSRNVRPLSNLETERDKEVDGGVRKGDTFPRKRRNSTDRDRRMVSTAGTHDGKSQNGQRAKPRRLGVDDRERDRGKTWGRERYEDRHVVRSRATEEGRRGGEGGPGQDEDLNGRQRRPEPGTDRDRDTGRRREKPRTSGGERGVRTASPRRQRDRETYSNRREREEGRGREGRRDTRSEADIDERETTRERMRERGGGEFMYKHSQSDGDVKAERTRDVDREGHRGEDYQRHRDREREEYRHRRTDQGGGRWGECGRDLKDERGRGDGDRCREHRQKRDRDNRDSRDSRDTLSPRREYPTGRSNRSLNTAPPRGTPRSQSSGEWSSSDVDNEQRYRRGGGSYEEREVGGEGSTADRRHGGQKRSEERERERERGREGDKVTGCRPEHRRMWLEPQRGGKRGGEVSVVSQAEWVREVRPEKEEPEERHWGSYSRRGAESHDAEGVSVDEDGGWGGESEGENSSQGSDSGGGGGGGEGGDQFTWSKTGRGSEPGRKEVRDSMVSVEDGFVTVSSGGDEGEEEEEEEEDRDEEFQDCQEFLDAGGEHHKHPVGGEGGEQHPQYVFCVIGQTLPRPPHHQRSPGDDISSQDPEDTPEDRDRLQDLEGESRTRAEHPYEEIGNFQRDSQTERLLTQWRERNTGGGLAPDLVLDGISSGTMSPEDVEAIHIRLSGAWSMSEEPKRHSQAPHLKWAKNVVQEILGNSEEGIIGEADSAEQNRRTAEPPQLEVKGHDPEQKVSEETRDIPDVTVTPEEVRFEPQPEEDEPPDVDELRGMGQSRADTSTHTHSDTPLGAEPRGHRGIETERVEVKVSEEEEDEGTFLSVSRSLYKPHSCPSLNFQNESDSLAPPKERESRAEENESEEEEQGQEAGVEVGGPEETDTYSRGPEEAPQTPLATLTSSCSFRDLGSSARMRRRGIRKTTERRNAVLVEEEEQEGVGRDRRTRIFSKSDDEDDRSKSWGEVELRTVLDSIDRQKRNSVLFSAKLYQLYSEEAQNFEILRQSRSDVLSVCEDHAHSPAPSPPPARRPLPPLPPVPHPHSLSHTGSVTSVRSLPLPEPPRSEGRPSSPRLSISLTQSASLWRDLPGVRNSSELQELNEDQRRLQEIRFEVVTSEASYCRSLDIVVEHFVKSKQLGALLTTQDRNWLFSRLADVRAISHSFLSKLEERMESNIVHFTVCDIIARQCQRFKMVYVPYLTNQSYQDATYQRLMNENPGFKQIVEKLERSPVCQRLPLRSFLVLPFQRITRIKLLVQNIVKRTTPGTPEAMQAVKALKLLEKLIQESNDSISQMKSIESLVSLSARVDFECRTLPLISQSRRLVREGAVLELMDFSLKDTERSVYIHLFNDYLLLSIQKEGGRFTVIDHSPVSELRAENCRVKLHSLQKNLFRLHMSNRALLLRTDKQSDKLRWISALSRPHPDIDFSAAQDFPQMQCIRAFVGQQPDELSLEKADVILVHQQSSDRTTPALASVTDLQVRVTVTLSLTVLTLSSTDWVEGTRLSDRHRGWVPESHLEIINNSRVRQRNLSDALKLTTARAAV